MKILLRAALAGVTVCAACTLPGEGEFDLLISGGMIYDGSGQEPFTADVGLRDDRIVFVGQAQDRSARRILDATGLAVAPGFVNVLSWATESLLFDGRSLSDLRQGVTTEIFGEGSSMGPLNESMKAELGRGLGEQRYAVEWTTLREYLDTLVARGTSCNVASLVGATTLRIHEIGYEDRAPTAAELERMKALLAREMEAGALGLGSSLIYAPAFYATTEELIALCRVVADYGGIYATHLRSEAERFLEALDEALRIGREAGVPVEIWHLKAAGESNWPKLERAFEKIEAARSSGQRVTADIYNYTAGATGLNAAFPPWVQEGGYDAWAERLRDPKVRERLATEMSEVPEDWESLYLAAGSGEKVLLVGFENPALQALTGRTLASVADERGLSEIETMIELVLEDGSRVEAVYFLMSEENLAKKIAKPWVSFCSDAGSLAPEGDFLLSNPHPRAYGNFARLLGRYVRDEGVISLAEAVRRLTSHPAETFGLVGRGRIEVDSFADLVIFDPKSIRDRATYANPHQLAEGVRDVMVNGRLVLEDQRPTGRYPGRALRGPGARRTSAR